MSDNIFGTTPTSTLISVAEVALKVMQGKSPIKEDWFKDEAEKVEHKWKRFNTKLRVKWLAQIKVMAKKEDMSQEELDDRLDDYGLVKFPREKVWDEAQKIKPKWKKMSTSARTKWLDNLDDLAIKTHTSHADVQSILDDAKLKKEEFEEEVELTELLKSKDKSVIDAFYKEDSLVGRVLSTDGKSLEKHGVGGQTIAAWLKGKIAITAVSDVKSTESILNYMKKSIPKNNFDPKSYKKFFEEVEVAEAKMSDPMIAKLKQKYEPLRGKRLSLGQNTEIAKIVSGMGKDKEVLLQLVKADIPFISLNAATFLMDKHGMKAKDINLGNKLVRKQEIKSKIIDDSYHGTFAGNDVFIVNSDTFHTCRLGKQKYHRYEKYVGNGKIGQAIREFGLTNPKKPIILQNGEGGPMLYLRYGGSKRYA